MDNQRGIIVIIMILIFLVLSIVWIIHTIRIIRLDRRISHYTVIKSEQVSIFDSINQIYLGLRDRVRDILNTLGFSNYKYRHYNYLEYDDNVKFLASKVMCSLLFFFISLFTGLLIGNVNIFVYVLLITIVSFFIPNIVLFIRHYMVVKQMEQDLLKAVTLMNHSFQAGNSILQAIQLVSKELQTPLGDEFSKIYQDMLYGLSITTAFKRFSDRVGMEEVNYITTSLSILNKTGGDIVSVFQSIEKNFYIRRRLNQEFDAIISSSKILFYILTSVPILLFLVISIFSPNYFGNLFSHPIGFLIFTIIILLYIIYLVVIRRIMKVDKY